jgi:hypothetical protein
MTVATDNQTATSNLQSAEFMTNHLVVAPGADPEVSSSGSPTPRESLPPSAQIEQEETLWEDRYSSKNFLGRLIIGGLLAVAWVVLAVMTWGIGYSNLWFLTDVLGAAVVFYSCFMGYKFIRARRNHAYRLTTRRLFLTTGVLQRRVDQGELVRIKDLFVKQSLLGTWLDVGNVILVSSEPTLPKAVLLGIEEPRRVMDLIWRHTRSERDQRTSEVNQV